MKPEKHKGTYQPFIFHSTSKYFEIYPWNFDGIKHASVLCRLRG